MTKASQPQPITLTKRSVKSFWASVKKTDSCWLWTGHRNADSGYGTITTNWQKRRAHRVSWAIHYGPVPFGMHVLHRCDVPLCVNPAHLWLGTHQDNMDDMKAKGRAKTHRGAMNGTAKLSEQDVIAIRQMPGSSMEIAGKFGVSDAHIRLIRLRKVWRHVQAPGLL